MIEYITGEVTELTPATAVVECMGIGYLLNISLNTSSSLAKGKSTRLYVYEPFAKMPISFTVLATVTSGSCSWRSSRFRGWGPTRRA